MKEFRAQFALFVLGIMATIVVVAATGSWVATPILISVVSSFIFGVIVGRQ